MTKEIGVLTIHGIGMQDENFDEALIANFRHQLSAAVFESIQFEQVFYQNLIQPNQERVFHAMQSQPLRWRRLRKFMLFYFSDAAAYQHNSSQIGSIYFHVHGRVYSAMSALHEAFDYQDKPVVIIGHSLGCFIMSNYIWDAQQAGKPDGKPTGIWQTEIPNPFQQMRSLRYFFSTGCNIPLFVSGLPYIAAIERPNEQFRWLNYYDKDDVLGWPLKPLSQDGPHPYDDVVEADIEINVGASYKPWISATPLSHMEYWSSAGFIEPAASMLTALHAEVKAQ